MVMPTEKTCEKCGRLYMQSDAKEDFRDICDGCRDPRSQPLNKCVSFGDIMATLGECKKLDDEDIALGKAIRCKCTLLADEFIGVTEKGEKKYYCKGCHKITLGPGRTQCLKTAQDKVLKLEV